MPESNDTSRQTILLGLGAIIVTLLVASGEWSVYDFGIAISIACFGLYFLKNSHIGPMSKWEVILFALPFALLTTAALTALLSFIAFYYPSLAEVDFETYKAIYEEKKDVTKKPAFEVKKSQATYQWLTFLFLFVIWAVGFYLWRRKKKRSKEKKE